MQIYYANRRYQTALRMYNFLLLKFLKFLPGLVTLKSYELQYVVSWKLHLIPSYFRAHSIISAMAYSTLIRDGLLFDIQCIPRSCMA